MELRMKVDSSFMKELGEILGESSNTQLTSEALGLLKWAAREVKAGRHIITTNADGEEVKELAMPSLERVRPIK